MASHSTQSLVWYLVFFRPLARKLSPFLSRVLANTPVYSTSVRNGYLRGNMIPKVLHLNEESARIVGVAPISLSDPFAYSLDPRLNVTVCLLIHAFIRIDTII